MMKNDFEITEINKEFRDDELNIDDGKYQTNINVKR
jgi:hypothetical protein